VPDQDRPATASRDDLGAVQSELERATAAAGVPTRAEVHK